MHWSDHFREATKMVGRSLAAVTTGYPGFLDYILEFLPAVISGHPGNPQAPSYTRRQPGEVNSIKKRYYFLRH